MSHVQGAQIGSVWMYMACYVMATKPGKGNFKNSVKVSSDFITISKTFHTSFYEKTNMLLEQDSLIPQVFSSQTVFRIDKDMVDKSTCI